MLAQKNKFLIFEQKVKSFQYCINWSVFVLQYKIKTPVVVVSGEGFLPAFLSVVIAVYSSLLIILFQATFHVTGTLPLFLRPMKAFTSSELYPNCFLLLFFYQVFCFWSCCCCPTSATNLRGHFLHSSIFYLTFFPHILCMQTQLALIKVSLEASSSFLKGVGLPTVVQNINLTHLFELHNVYSFF